MSKFDGAQYQRTLTQFLSQARQANKLNIRELFDSESDRLDTLSYQAAGLYVDLSRNPLPLNARQTLQQLVQSSGLAEWRQQMFAGETINTSENRAVFHVALRAPAGMPMPLGQGRDVSAEVQQTLGRMRDFTEQIRDGRWLSANGQRFTDVVNVGIGGSQLGPLLACEALTDPEHPSLNIHFLANIDPTAWDKIRARLDPHKTLVVIASKSWKTAETARNAQAVRQWLLDAGIEQNALDRHLVGVTANPAGAKAFGLSDNTVFPFSDWVGGRYSLWSAIGLPVMLSIGSDRFDAMLAGAHAMDQHFLNADWDNNIPIMMALTSLWNSQALGAQTEAVVPYCASLGRLPAYLQQLQMESNGKRVDIDGQSIGTIATPVVWGEPGTDAQHSFFQALHQSAQAQPVDFVLVKPKTDDRDGRARGLIANALAQAEALLMGQRDEANPHRHYPGNRPSSTILLNELSARNFGALIALYEHKTAAFGWLIRINSFDQWGVELGKEIAERHEKLIAHNDDDALAALNPSIRELFNRLRFD